MAYRIPESVLKFSNGNTALYDMFSDYWNEYRSREGKKNISFSTVNKNGEPITFEQKKRLLTHI